MNPLVPPPTRPLPPFVYHSPPVARHAPTRNANNWNTSNQTNKISRHTKPRWRQNGKRDAKKRAHSLLAVFLLSGVSLEVVLASAMDLIRQLRHTLRHPTQLVSAGSSSISELVERALDSLLPENAHELCSNRLGVSVTKVGWPMENRFLSVFNSRRELIDAVRAGCFIPLWSGSLWGPKLAGGSHFIDGACSNNSPKFHDLDLDLHQARGRALRVQLSPFSCEAEVSPKGEWFLFRGSIFGTVYLATWGNLQRFWHAMLPYHLTAYRAYLINGHRDMKDYLLRNNLIKCRRCYANSPLGAAGTSNCLAEAADDHHNSPPRAQTKCDTASVASATTTTTNASELEPTACLSCLMLLERVDNLRVPDELLDLVVE